MNCAPTLGRAFDSILQQTLLPERIIVVYDTSIDDTFSVVQSYIMKYPDLFMLVYGFGRGVGAARQVGLQVLESDYVAFIDGDDWYLENALETLFQGVSMTGAVCGLVCKVYPNGKRQKRVPSGIESTINYDTLKKGNPIAMSSTMFDARLVREIGGIDDNLPWIEDYDFHLRIAQVADYNFIGKVTTFYTVYESTNLRRTYHYSKWSAIVWRKHGFVNYHAIWRAVTSTVITVLLVPVNLLWKTRRRNTRIIQMEYIQILIGYIVGLAIGYRPRTRRSGGKRGLKQAFVA